jgi:hypothetical protein
MSSLCDIAHEGRLCTITILQHLEISSAHSYRQLLSGQPVRYRKGRRYGPSITYKITPAGSLSYTVNQAGRRVGPALYPSASLFLKYCMIGYFNYCLFFLFKVRNFPFKNMLAGMTFTSLAASYY